MTGQLVVSATVSSMLISHPRAAESRPFRLPRATSRFAGQIVVPRSTHAREQRFSGPTLRIASSRFMLTVASELKLDHKLATACRG